MNNFNEQQMKQLQLRLLRATNVILTFLKYENLSKEIPYMEAKKWLAELKGEKLFETKEDIKPKRIKISARRINSVEWAGTVNGQDVCRAKTEDAAKRLAKRKAA